ncbi:MAG: phosphate transporter, permease protein [Verrucomicrobiota bacterium]
MAVAAFTAPTRRLDKAVEALMVWLLRIGGWASVLVTFGIIVTLVTESAPFFAKVPFMRLIQDTMWTPLFSDPQYGIGALLAGTLVTTGVALAVAIPLGTILAIYLSEFAPAKFRERRCCRCFIRISRSFRCLAPD